MATKQRQLSLLEDKKQARTRAGAGGGKTGPSGRSETPGNGKLGKADQG